MIISRLVGPLKPALRSGYLETMVKSASATSRTLQQGRRGLAGTGLDEARIRALGDRNLREAATYLLDSAHTLALGVETAREINLRVTRDLVPSDVIGRPDYWTNPSPFYSWLGSNAARRLAQQDPVAFAERIHHDLAYTESFPDGNGRTARLMADLALIQSGRPPALHRDLETYFQRGSPRAPVPRAEQLRYFREAAALGRDSAPTQGPN